MSITFDEEGARLIVKATREALRRPKGRVPRPAPPATLLPIRYARVTRAIKAGTPAGPGRGMAGLVCCAYADNDDATYGPTGDAYNTYSCGLSEIAVGTIVMVSITDGRLHVIVEVCPGDAGPSGAGTAGPAGYSPSGFDSPGFTPPGY